MAWTKISELTELTTPTGNEELVYSYNDTNGKIKISNLSGGGNSFYVDALVVGGWWWWGWRSGANCSSGWWWWGGWVCFRYKYSLEWNSFPVVVWAWWTAGANTWTSWWMWGNSCFSWIIAWGGGWWWGWSSSAVSWSWWCICGWSGGWAAAWYGSWTYWWLWFDWWHRWGNSYCRSFWWGWGGAGGSPITMAFMCYTCAMSSSFASHMLTTPWWPWISTQFWGITITLWAGGAGSLVQNGGYTDTWWWTANSAWVSNCWWWGWGWVDNSYCWCAYAWWVWWSWTVIIRYPTDWSYWINCATWWTVTTCTISWTEYKIHKFNSSWTFCIVS